MTRVDTEIRHHLGGSEAFMCGRTPRTALRHNPVTGPGQHGLVAHQRERGYRVGAGDRPAAPPGV